MKNRFLYVFQKDFEIFTYNSRNFFNWGDFENYTYNSEILKNLGLL